MNKPSGKSAAWVVTGLGLSAASWTARLVWKWTKWLIQMVVANIQGPKPYVEVIDAGQYVKDILKIIVAWGVARKLIAAPWDFKKLDAPALARIIHNDLLPKISWGAIPVGLSKTQSLDDWWARILSNHAIPHIFY